MGLEHCKNWKNVSLPEVWAAEQAVSIRIGEVQLPQSGIIGAKNRQNARQVLVSGGKFQKMIKRVFEEAFLHPQHGILVIRFRISGIKTEQCAVGCNRLRAGLGIFPCLNLIKMTQVQISSGVARRFLNGSFKI